MGELVRYLVGEEKRPEHAPSLSEALSSISDSIVTSPAEPDAPSPPQLLDPAGAPISTGVLCFDEVQVMDVADAAIFTGVLERLFDAGWVLVATCNRSLGDFAQSHAHREHPQARFTREMRSRCELVELDGADYRRQLAAAPQPTFFTPLDESSAAALDERFEQLTSGEAVSTEAPISFGRTLRLLACNARGVARCDFEKVCGGSFGAADYIALAQRYHTLVLTGLPRLSLRERDKARRFITLVDQLYNHKTLLIASAAAPPEQLFIGASVAADDGALLEGLEFEGEAGKVADLNPIGVTANSLARAKTTTGAVSADSRKGLARDSLFTGEDEAFAFERAISRLYEMQSSSYMEARERG